MKREAEHISWSPKCIGYRCVCFLPCTERHKQNEVVKNMVFRLNNRFSVAYDDDDDCAHVYKLTTVWPPHIDTITLALLLFFV